MVIIYGTWTADKAGVYTLRQDQRIKVKVRQPPGEVITEPLRLGIEADFSPGETVPGRIVHGKNR